VVKRDAKTTDADTAAFVDKTEVKLHPNLLADADVADLTW
jgi:hypothetical protein